MNFKGATNAERIVEALCREFPHLIEEVTQLSRNTSAGKDFIICNHKSVNFDKVWNFARTSANLEKSPDTIICAKDTIYFIEFKEGKHARDDVRQKVHEGVLTLFQFVIAKGIVSREDFFNVRIRFALIRRHADEKASFLNVLEASHDIFDLRNMEGFIVDKTAVAWKPRSILNILHSASSGVINQIEWVSADQSVRQTVSI